jgi:hypothetical protein
MPSQKAGIASAEGVRAVVAGVVMGASLKVVVDNCRRGGHISQYIIDFTM